MVGQFQVLDGKLAGNIFLARRFPLWIGRSLESQLRLEEPGVWDRHIQVVCDPLEGFVAEVHRPALARLNGEAMERGALRSGDVLELGGVRLQFWLPPLQVRDFRLREALTWVGLTLLAGVQIGLAYWLSQ